MGGCAEIDAKFAQHLCQQTGAVVVCATYRFGPAHPFPAAIDDVDDVVNYLLKNCKRLWKADPELFTICGFSAGGNLATATSMGRDVKALVGFYAAVSECFLK